jgi:hypothetical protein
MRTLLSMLLLGLPLLSSAQALQPGAYFVKEAMVEERLAPAANAKSTNKIYVGQAVQVFEVRDGWARVSKFYDGEVEGQSGRVARWVPAKALSVTKPAAPAQKKQKKDSRILNDAIPSVGQGGLTQKDVDILYRGATKYLDSGRCSRIEYADKSASKPNTYYVNCGRPKNIFFTPADL